MEDYEYDYEDYNEHDNEEADENEQDGYISETEYSDEAGKYTIGKITGIDTNGVDHHEIQQMNIGNELFRNSIGHCSICGKFYKREMTMMYFDEKMCYHCLFFLNYDYDLRQNVDGVYDMTIADYILKCAPEHDKTKCTRFDSCFLCDKLNKREIIGIIDSDLLLNSDSDEKIVIDL